MSKPQVFSMLLASILLLLSVMIVTAQEPTPLPPEIIAAHSSPDQSVYRLNEWQQLDTSSTNGDLTLTAERAYADRHQLVIEYRVTGPDSLNVQDKLRYNNVEVFDAQDNYLSCNSSQRRVPETSLSIGLGTVFCDLTSYQPDEANGRRRFYGKPYFDLFNTPPDAYSVTLFVRYDPSRQAPEARPVTPTPMPEVTEEPGQTSSQSARNMQVDFTVPIKQFATIAVNQRIEQRGLAITLEKIEQSLNYLQFDLCLTITDPARELAPGERWYPKTVSVNALGVGYRPAPGFSSNSFRYIEPSEDTCAIVLLNIIPGYPPGTISLSLDHLQNFRYVGGSVPYEFPRSYEDWQAILPELEAQGVEVVIVTYDGFYENGGQRYRVVSIKGPEGDFNWGMYPSIEQAMINKGVLRRLSGPWTFDVVTIPGGLYDSNLYGHYYAVREETVFDAPPPGFQTPVPPPPVTEFRIAYLVDPASVPADSIAQPETLQATFGAQVFTDWAAFQTEDEAEPFELLMIHGGAVDTVDREWIQSRIRRGFTVIGIHAEDNALREMLGLPLSRGYIPPAIFADIGYFSFSFGPGRGTRGTGMGYFEVKEDLPVLAEHLSYDLQWMRDYVPR
jgi:hypothetical protein